VKKAPLGTMVTKVNLGTTELMAMLDQWDQEGCKDHPDHLGNQDPLDHKGLLDHEDPLDLPV